MSGGDRGGSRARAAFLRTRARRRRFSNNDVDLCVPDWTPSPRWKCSTFTDRPAACTRRTVLFHICIWSFPPAVMIFSASAAGGPPRNYYYYRRAAARGGRLAYTNISVDTDGGDHAVVPSAFKSLSIGLHHCYQIDKKKKVMGKNGKKPINDNPREYSERTYTIRGTYFWIKNVLFSPTCRRFKVDIGR